MSALLFAHRDPRLLVSIQRLVIRRRLPCVLARDDRAALSILGQMEISSVIVAVDLPSGGGVEFLETVRTAHPLVGRFLIGERTSPPDLEPHFVSSLVHGYFPLPLDLAELLGCAVAPRSRTPSAEQRAARQSAR